MRDLFERVIYGGFLLVSMVGVMVMCEARAPSVGYLKALDVWVVSCFVFISVALFEVICMHLITSRREDGPTNLNEFELMVMWFTNVTLNLNHSFCNLLQWVLIYHGPVIFFKNVFLSVAER